MNLEMLNRILDVIIAFLILIIIIYSIKLFKATHRISYKINQLGESLRNKENGLDKR